MAMRDMKEYYYTILNQWVEAKDDLKEFDKALKEGHITEDKLQSIKDDVEQIGANVARVQYIIFLLNLPNTKEKKKRYLKANQDLVNYFKEIGVDTSSISDENYQVLTHLKAEINKMSKDKE